MKTIFSFSAIIFSSLFFGQILINPGSQTSVTNTSVSVEFGSEARGIILPYVKASDVADAVAGTFIMDYSDRAMKLKLPNGVWQNFTGDAARTNSIVNPFALIAESKNAKVVIGSPTIPEADVPGILILSDPNKAMILPKVESPHLTIKNPAAGMMVYDSLNKILAVFNGTQWSFWKP